MRWCVFTIKTVDLTWFKHDDWDLTWFSHENWCVFTIEKVDLLWEMRILHDFTKQKWWFSIFLTKKTMKTYDFYIFLTITSFFEPNIHGDFTRNPCVGKFTARFRHFGLAPVCHPRQLPGRRGAAARRMRRRAGMLGDAGGWRFLVRWWIIKHGGLKQKMDRNDGKRSPGSAFCCWFNPASCWFVTMEPYDLLIFNHETIWFNQQRLPFNDGKLRFKSFFRFDEVFIGISGWFE